MGGHCDCSTLGKINLGMPLATEKQKCVPLVYIPRTCVAVYNAVSIESAAMETQQRVQCIVALHTSLITITHRSSHKVTATFLSNFNQIWNYSTDFFFFFG